MKGFATLLCLLSVMTVKAQNLQKGDYGFLYRHMSGEGEWTAYALSRDGLNYHDLIDGKEVYDTEKLSEIEGGARDAYICRKSDSGKGYLMVTTDMSNRKSRTWFNYGINLLRSDNLTDWTAKLSIFVRAAASSATRNRLMCIRTGAPSNVYGLRRFSGTQTTPGLTAQRADI